MQKLSQSERQVLECLWRWPDGASISAVTNTLPAPTPPYTTVASTLQQLVCKGFVRAEKRGRSNWFSPRLSGSEFASRWLAWFVMVHFAGSYTELIRFCLQQGQLSQQDLREVLHQVGIH